MQTIIDIIRHLALHDTAVWLALTYIAVVLAMAVDFVAGVRKAHQAGVATTSRGFKMTTEKATKYFLPMLCLSCIDIITSVVLPAPFFTILMGGFNIFCEWKSVLESTHDKQELRDKAHTFNVIVKNKDDIAAIVMQAMELMDRYKGCDGRMHELPTHTVTHNERVKEMFISSIDVHHSVTMDTELTSHEARAVFQASFPNAIEVKDILVSECRLRGDSQQSELRFDAPVYGVPHQRFPHYYAIDGEGIIRFISNGEPVDESDINLAEDSETAPELVAFFQRTLDSIADELTPKLWLFFVTHVTRLDFHLEFTMVEKHLCVIDRGKQIYDAGVLTPVSASMV